MFSKQFLFIFAIFVSFNSIQCEYNSILDVAQAALDAANDLINNTVTEAIRAIEAIKIASHEVALDLSEIAIALIEETNNRILQKLEEIKNNNTDNVEEQIVINCVEVALEKLETLEYNAANGTAICLAEKLDDALDSLENISNDILQGNSNIRVIQDNLTGCENSTDVNECVQLILQDIVREVVNVTEKAIRDTEIAAEILVHLPVQLSKCRDDQVDAILEEGNKILAETLVCIQTS